MSKDLLLYENGNGGELLVLNNDLSLVEALYQQIYVCLFGGNLEANTTGSESITQQRFDWWGNSLLFSNRKAKQFNSNTERVLESVVLNSSGRIDIQRAVEYDLNFLKKTANIKVDVLILSDSKVKIKISLQKPEFLEDKIYQFIWDNAKNEIIINKTI